MSTGVVHTQFRVETPEAIDLSVQLAGAVPRTIAYGIDISIRLGITLGLVLILSFMGNAGIGFFLALSFLLEWFYPVYFELFREGQTPGKKALGIAVVNDNLTPVSPSASIIRNLLRAVDFLPVAYGLGLVSITVSRHFQRFGDLAAGTVVVYRDTSLHSGALPAVSPVAPPLRFTPEEVTALTGFAQRHEQLSEQRNQELAAILEPLTGKTGEDAVRHVQGMGCWLLGDKQ